MGVTVTDLLIYKSVFNNLFANRQPGQGPLRVASLGYPDVILMDEHYDKFFPGKDWRALLQPRENRKNLIAIHGATEAQISLVPTMESFFALYGEMQVDAIDIGAYVGSELLHNMNEPIPQEWEGRYDLVIDSGSTEHFFDIARGLFNCARLVKVGGIIYHTLPLNVLNHGFYNINPTLMYDFYEDNGFQTIECRGAVWGLRPAPVYFNVPPMQRFQVNGEANLLYVAKKLSNPETLIKPVQRRYRNMQAWQ